MTIGLVGRKCGMTRVFTAAGESVPVTVIEALPNRIVHERVLLFCFGATLNYVVFKYIWSVYPPQLYPWMNYTSIMGISVILIFGLPLLHLACTIRMPARGDLTPQPPLRRGEGEVLRGG